MNRMRPLHHKHFLGLGSLAILLSLVINPVSLAYLFSPDNNIETESYITAIIIMQMLLFVLGLLCLVSSVFRRHKVFRYLVFTVVVLVISVLSAEAILFAIRKASMSGRLPSRKGSIVSLDGRDIQQVIIKDAELGYKYHPDVKYHVIRSVGKKVIYNSTVTVDEFSRRVTPYEERESSDKFMLFFGCSFTWGTGLNDDQTIPYFMGRKAGGHIPYNYGAEAGGPHNMLARLRSEGFKREISERKGVAVYLFIDDHVRRVKGPMSVYYGIGADAPYFYLDGNNLVREGTLRSGRKVASFFYSIMASSNIVNLLTADFPPMITDYDASLCSRLVAESQRRFTEVFPNSRFVVVLYPTGKRRTELRKKMMARLKDEKIEVFDYTDLFDPLDPQFNIGGDGHPSEHANKMLADKLYSDLIALNLIGE